MQRDDLGGGDVGYINGITPVCIMNQYAHTVRVEYLRSTRKHRIGVKRIVKYAVLRTQPKSSKYEWIWKD
jgi:hypothetical protein